MLQKRYRWIIRVRLQNLFNVKVKGHLHHALGGGIGPGLYNGGMRTGSSNACTFQLNLTKKSCFPAVCIFSHHYLIFPCVLNLLTAKKRCRDSLSANPSWRGEMGGKEK